MRVGPQLVDATGLVELDEIRILRVIVRMQQQRGVGAAAYVHVQEGGEVDVEPGVAVEHEKVFIEAVQGVREGARRAAWRLLQAVFELDAEAAAVAEVRGDRFVAEVHEQRDARQSGRAALRDLLFQHRPATNRHHRLGQARAAFAQTRAAAAGEDRDLCASHGLPSKIQSLPTSQRAVSRTADSMP